MNNKVCDIPIFCIECYPAICPVDYCLTNNKNGAFPNIHTPKIPVVLTKIFTYQISSYKISVSRCISITASRNIQNMPAIIYCSNIMDDSINDRVTNIVGYNAIATTAVSRRR